MPGIEQTFLVRRLSPVLISRFLPQENMSVGEDGASAVLNSATNDTSGGLRENK
jgi:hypothetical protein